MEKGTQGGMGDDLRPEYDLSRLLHGGVRGKYAERFRASATSQLRSNIDPIDPDDMVRSRCLFHVVEDDHG